MVVLICLIKIVIISMTTMMIFFIMITMMVTIIIGDGPLLKAVKCSKNDDGKTD